MLWLYMTVPRARTEYKELVLHTPGIHGMTHLMGWSSLAKDIRTHEYVYIGPDCKIGPGVEIRAYTMLAPRVDTVGGRHRYDRPGIPMQFAGRALLHRTSIGADTWLGFGCIILAGVTIGRGSIAATGAVATHDVRPYPVVGGVPGKFIQWCVPSAEDRALHDAMFLEQPRAGHYAGALQVAAELEFGNGGPNEHTVLG